MFSVPQVEQLKGFLSQQSVGNPIPIERFIGTCSTWQINTMPHAFFLDICQENCVGEFDVDSLLPLSSTIAKLENKCPKLVELQEQFGRERLRLLVTGQV